MSGHNKWSTIKHAKGAADAKRGALFTKLIKEISIAASMGGGDPDSNPRLRAAIVKARAASMPKDNIKRAIDKGTGAGAGAAIYQELVYEGYAQGGVAVLVEVLTDNKNRAAANVRNIFSKNGGNLGTSGSVSRMFDRKGVIVLDGEKISEDEVMEVALEAGAEDVVAEDGVITITTDPNDFTAVVEAIQAKHDAGLSPKEEETPESEKWASLSAAVSMVPQMTTAVDLDTAAKVKKLLDRLEEDDDVQAVWSTVEYPDDFEDA